MSQITYTSSNGMTVSIPAAEHAAITAAVAERKYAHGLGPALTLEQRVKSCVLNAAGRALKHRRDLAAYYVQEIPADDLEFARAIAVQAKREGAVIAAAYDIGYGPYMARSLAGRHVDPGTMGRIRERAAERARTEIEHLKREPLTLDDIDYGLKAQGYMVSADAEYSRCLTMPTWVITAPDGWNGQLATAQEATA